MITCAPPTSSAATPETARSSHDRPADTRSDQLALVQNRLDHIARQMGWVMIRTSRSPIFNQSHDFSCFITDARRHARVAGRRHSDPHRRRRLRGARPAQARSPAASIRDDAFLLNDPYVAGGNHLPDWVIARPVFACGAAVRLLPAIARTSRTSAAAPPAPTTRRRPRSSTKASACRR